MVDVQAREHQPPIGIRLRRGRGKGKPGMLPTFVIGLREGVEAALIVGIIAAFLIQRKQRGAIRSMWVGVGAAIVLCLGVAVALSVHRPEPALQAAGDHGRRPGADRGRRRDLHDRVDAPTLPRAQGSPRGERGRRARGRFLDRAGRHGVLRRAPRRARDRDLHAGGLPELHRPLGHRPGSHSRGDRRCGPGLRDLQGRHPHQPQPLLPDHRVRAGPGGGRAPGQRGALPG